MFERDPDYEAWCDEMDSRADNDNTVEVAEAA